LSPSKYAAARAKVEVLLDGMAAETEKRRDWYAQPVESWREGKLEIETLTAKQLLSNCRSDVLVTIDNKLSRAHLRVGFATQAQKRQK
jgi:DNA repair ATPase RecN